MAKVKISDEIINNECSTVQKRNKWLAEYKVHGYGDEPDTMEAFGIPFEKSGIIPFGFTVSPFNPQYGLNEIGLAKMFADEYKNRVRYCVNQKQWYIFDCCKGWIADKNSKILDIYQRFISKLAYAYSLIDNDDYRKVFGKFLKCTSISTCDNILRHAAKYYPFDAIEMDAKIDIVAAHNGVIQLDRENGTFDFRSFHPDDMTTKRMSVIYDPDAKCPRWEQFIAEIMNGDAELITFLQIFLGQMMYGRNEQKAFGIFLGVTTNNGKSTLVEALKDLLGDYAVSVSESVISKGNNNQINELEQLAKTQGARMVSLPEPRQNLQLNEQVLKSFTGNGSIHVRRLYQEGFDIQPGATLIIDTNYELALRDMSVFHRKSVILFPFNVSFSENQIDTRLFEKLRAESSGILNWILKGWEMYCALTPNSCQWTLPARMQQVINEYAHDSDIIHRFIEENYQITTNRSDVVPMAELYQRYRTWSLENGDSPRSAKNINPEIKHKLAELLDLPKDMLPVRKTNGGTMCYYGLRPLRIGEESVVSANYNVDTQDTIAAFQRYCFCGFGPSSTGTPVADIMRGFRAAHPDCKITAPACMGVLETLSGQPIVDGRAMVESREAMAQYTIHSCA